MSGPGIGLAVVDAMNIQSNKTRVAMAVGALAAGLVLVACATRPSLPPVDLASNVDLPRFMGDWYVIANIPTFIEKDAHGAKESYVLAADGAVDTTFTFHADSFGGPQREYHSRGVVQSPGNAVWGQQYLWPFKADYRISYVAPDYGTTVITRDKRDYVWIMARTPTIPDAELDKLIAFVGTQGYDTSKIQRVPQQPASR